MATDTGGTVSAGVRAPNGGSVVRGSLVHTCGYSPPSLPPRSIHIACPGIFLDPFDRFRVPVPTTKLRGTLFRNFTVFHTVETLFLKELGPARGENQEDTASVLDDFLCNTSKRSPFNKRPRPRQHVHPSSMTTTNCTPRAMQHVNNRHTHFQVADAAGVYTLL